MKVRSVYQPKVRYLEGWESLRDAARRMRDGGYDCLPVMCDGELVGIITEHDLVEAMADVNQAQAASVFDFMTEEPRTVGLDDDCSVAATEMLAIGCRHLPVVEGGTVVGMVSSRDLLPLATAGVVEG
ncbi:MAG TPA: CBS domain-containing protein [Candidatus Dormibacteraeota bacterium]|nr:CBS domain-containing protein [Candidatus Dormibacteraeota bacterium]